VKLLDATAPDFEEEFEFYLAQEEQLEASVEASVVRIIQEVEARGDNAVIEFTRHYDDPNFDGKQLLVPPAQLEAAWRSLGPTLKSALELAHERITEYAKREILPGFKFVDEVGMHMERRVVPMSRVGIHVPGGANAFPGLLLQSAIPAKVAGVEEVIVICPIDPNVPAFNTILATAHLAGVDKFFRVGGVQAIAAMAFGTESIPRVDTIAGFGNIYVATAKRLLQRRVGIASIAGPSEIVVIADGTLDPKIAAADLLAQAEHDIHSRCFLCTTDRAYADQVLLEIDTLLERLPKAEIARGALEKYSAVIIVPDMETAVKLSDRIAPEQVEIATENARELARKVHNAGSVFVGPHTPESLANYVAGPNPILPTGGTARFAQGISTRSFVKSINVLRASRGALATLAPTAMLLAETEGMYAHAEAVRKRLK
jgi:histidinol dehydrogenase